MSSASSSTSDETVTLVSAEGEKFIVPKKVRSFLKLVTRNLVWERAFFVPPLYTPRHLP